MLSLVRESAGMHKSPVKLGRINATSPRSYRLPCSIRRDLAEGVPAKSARGSSKSRCLRKHLIGNTVRLQSAVTKYGSSMPSGVVPQDQQTSNKSSTFDRHFGHSHMSIPLVDASRSRDYLPMIPDRFHLLDADLDVNWSRDHGRNIPFLEPPGRFDRVRLVPAY